MSESLTDFVITKEHRRFAEFCDACRRYRYIGVCYGPPGVGKTLSARYYAKWEHVEALQNALSASDAALADVSPNDTVFYTPPVVNSPVQVQRDIRKLRHDLRTIQIETMLREEDTGLSHSHERVHTYPERYRLPAEGPTVKPLFRTIVHRYHQKHAEIPDPTTLIIIDEADRLKMTTLEQVRAIFDQGEVGLVFVGMPGLEKRLARYPQLYSRVGFVHAFRPLNADEVRHLFHHQWAPSGVVFPESRQVEEDALAAIIRITGGNFRLLNRLLTQIARLLEINALHTITPQVVETARESLVIGVI